MLRGVQQSIVIRDITQQISFDKRRTTESDTPLLNTLYLHLLLHVCMHAGVCSIYL